MRCRQTVRSGFSDSTYFEGPSSYIYGHPVTTFSEDEFQESCNGDKYRLPLYRNTRSIRNLSRIDLAEQSWVDGCVTVLARHNDERIVVETFGFQFADDGSE